MQRLFPTLLTTLLLIASAAQAQTTPPHLSSQPTIIYDTQMAETNKKAQAWNLQAKEYQRYLELMDGPLGIYSPGLDPLTALGISARNDEERRYYAELQVVAESLRVERELQYQRAYDEAFKRLYPGLLPVEFDLLPSPQPLSLQSATAMLSENGRMAVFIKENCRPCDLKVQQLQTNEMAFDIYMVGSNQDDVTIRRWATKVGLDPQKVFSRTITLNHDAGRWQSIGTGGELPAVVKKEGNQWQRQ